MSTRTSPRQATQDSSALGRPAVLSVAAHPVGGLADGAFTSALGDRLRGMVRCTDVVLAQGPGRFMVLCNGVPDEPVALAVTKRLEEAMDEELWVAGQQMGVQASVGVAMQAHAPRRPVEVLATAEQARLRSNDWIAEVPGGIAVLPDTAVVLLREPGSDGGELARMAGALATPATVVDGAVLIRLPDTRLVDAFAMGEEIRVTWPTLSSAAARIDDEGRTRLVTSGVQLCS